jgi:hypothetical protein
VSHLSVEQNKGDSANPSGMSNSLFLSCFSSVQRFILKYTNMRECIRLIDTYMDTNFCSSISRFSTVGAALEPSMAYRASLDLPSGAA